MFITFNVFITNFFKELYASKLKYMRLAEVNFWAQFFLFEQSFDTFIFWRSLLRNFSVKQTLQTFLCRTNLLRHFSVEQILRNFSVKQSYRHFCVEQIFWDIFLSNKFWEIFLSYKSFDIFLIEQISFFKKSKYILKTF